MKHCSSTYQEIPGIHSVDLKKLSPMTWKSDNRWYWRDMPTIIDNGLWYPLLYYKVTPEWWHGGFAGVKQYTAMWEHIKSPVVNEDGLIWALKMGTNRLQALKFMGFTSVDAVCFANANDLINAGVHFRDEDPLHHA